MCDAVCRRKASLASSLHPCTGELAGTLSLVHPSLGLLQAPEVGERTLDGHCLRKLVLASLSSVLTADGKAAGVSGSCLPRGQVSRPFPKASLSPRLQTFSPVHHKPCLHPVARSPQSSLLTDLFPFLRALF